MVAGLGLFCVMLYLTSHQCSCHPPNIILMLLDDVGWGDLGVNGNWAKETPYIDKMAAEGMLFTDFYAANPVCSPSRAALMTGRLPIRNGFYTTNGHAKNSFFRQDVIGGISEHEKLLPSLLKEAKYKSKIIGKWHLGQRKEFLPRNKGFDEFFGSLNNHYGPYDDVKMPNVPVFKNDKMIGRYFTNFTIDKQGRSNISQMFLSEGLSFIEEQHSAGNPFFLYWTPDANHDPSYASPMFHGKSVRGIYGDSVMEMDYCVGMILDKLKDLGIDKKTFVFFTSDNGAASYLKTRGGDNGPFLCGKLTTFEGGLRVPGIAWWPSKIRPGSISHQLGNTMDLFTTSLLIAGVEPPRDRMLDGLDLSSTLFGEEASEAKDRPIWYYRGNEMMAVRVGAYKAHYWTWTGYGSQPYSFQLCSGIYVENITSHHQLDHTESPVLFNLHKDPGEKYIISNDSAEYQAAMKIIDPIVKEHRMTFISTRESYTDCSDEESLASWNELMDDIHGNSAGDFSENKKKYGAHLEPSAHCRNNKLQEGGQDTFLESRLGNPVFNHCDIAGRSWSPPGCEELNYCLPVPESNRTLCSWLF